MRILIIEDNEEDLKDIEGVLTGAGHKTVGAKYGSIGLQFAREQQFDAIILDRMLPGAGDSEYTDGLDLLRILRNENNLTPVLVLSNLGDTDNRVKGLNAGADDYLAKNLETNSDKDELLARVRAIHRTANNTNPNEDQNKLVHEDLELIVDARTVHRGGKPIDLTAIEFNLLETLMRRSGVVVTRRMLVENAWPHSDPATCSNLLNVHIFNLRNKINEGFDVELLQTVTNIGYKLQSTQS